MKSDDERKGPELDPGRSRRPGPSHNIFLGTEAPVGETSARPPGPRRERADVDDMIRLARNFVALGLFSSAALVLVAFAGARMGVPPWSCLAAIVGGPLMTWAFVRTFATSRSSPGDGPGGQQSSGEP